MEEDAVGDVPSSTARTSKAETSGPSNLLLRPIKRTRHSNAGTSFSYSSRFKGVVAQQNGHWGAQIYANHQRIWLGTFRTESDAAAAYDSAAVKLRGGGRGKETILHRNFPWTDRTLNEPEFQKRYTVDAVLGMIRDGSYNSKLSDFIKSRHDGNGSGTANQGQRKGDELRDGFLTSKQLLFEKELTPSDVGKLNRLVIPKKYAVKYLPYVSEEDREIDDVELVVYDSTMKAWKFRYCYWRSSQSFVFTRGWNRFVKENGLKERDVVAFYKCEDTRKKETTNRDVLVIDVSHRSGTNGNGESRDLDLELKLGKACGFEAEEDETALANDEELRLFGVRIN